MPNVNKAMLYDAQTASDFKDRLVGGVRMTAPFNTGSDKNVARLKYRTDRTLIVRTAGNKVLNTLGQQTEKTLYLDDGVFSKILYVVSTHD